MTSKTKDGKLIVIYVFHLDMPKFRKRINDPKIKYTKIARKALNDLYDLVDAGKWRAAARLMIKWRKQGLSHDYYEFMDPEVFDFLREVADGKDLSTPEESFKRMKAYFKKNPKHAEQTTV